MSDGRGEAARLKVRNDTEALIEDINWMISTGDFPDRIATRLGYRSVERLYRRLNRYGHQDVVERLRLQDKSSAAYQRAHLTPMDEVVARNKARYRAKAKGDKAA